MGRFINPDPLIQKTYRSYSGYDIENDKFNNLELAPEGTYYNYSGYDPDQCRDTSKNPSIDSTNWYMYCKDNPINITDPDGLTSLAGFGDKLSNLSFGLNVLGVGLAGSSLVAGPEMLAPAEAVSACSAVVDVGAAGLYLTDAIITGDKNSYVKAGFAVVSVIGDVVMSSSVAVKPALNGANFYSKTTGKYVTTSATTVAKASKPFVAGTVVSATTTVVTDKTKKTTKPKQTTDKKKEKDKNGA